MTSADWQKFRHVGTLQNDISGGNLASAATIAPTGYLNYVTGSVEITTITVPYTGFAGSIVLIPDAAFTLATGGNIAKAAQGVQYRAMKMTYVNGYWYPEYVA